MTSRRWWIAAVSAILVGTACSESSLEIPDGQQPETLVLSLSSHNDSLPVGISRTLTASLRTTRGEARNGAVTWRSTAPEVAAVSDGQVTALTPGVASIIASSGAAADTARITVLPIIATTTVVPNAVEIVQGDSIRFSANFGGAGGASVVPVWQTSDSTIATIDRTGQLVAVAEGEVTVTAIVGSSTATASARVQRPVVASVSVSPTVASLSPGRTARLTATAYDYQGRVIDAKVSWRSSNTSVATVNGTGLVSAVARGYALVTATVDGKSATATINVGPTPVQSVSVTLSPSTLTEGSTGTATAVARDASGQAISGATIGWQSTNPAIATVSSTGVVAGIFEGTTTISAISGGVVGSATVTVIRATPAAITLSPAAPVVRMGDQVTLTARVVDAAGTPIPGLTPSLTSANVAIATIANDGTLSGISLGTTTITATYGALQASAVATVTSAPVASVAIAPSSAVVDSAATTLLTATTYDAEGRVLTGRVVSWTSSNTSVATVTTTGQVRGVRGGSATITATSEGRTATASVTVNSPPPAILPVARVDVVLNASTIDIGEGTQAVATLYDSLGNRLTGRAVTWSVSDGTLASVNSTGFVTATGAGSVGIMATSEGRTGATTLVVNPPPPAAVATVSLQVVADPISPGATTGTVVTLRDANGNVLTGRTVAYTSLQPTIATANGSGTVTGVTVGTATIVATSGGVSGADGVQVQSGAPAPSVLTSIVLSGATSMAAGTNAQVTVATLDQYGAPMATPALSWSSSNPTVATVSTTGRVFANGAGSATISASSGGVTGTLDVTVTVPPPAPVASVTVALSPSAVVAGAGSQATVTLRDAAGNLLSGRAVTFASTDVDIASVSATGVITTAAPGSVAIRATSEGITGSATLSVGPATVPVSVVLASLSPASVAPGGTSQLTVTLKDAQGNTLSGRPISYATSQPSVATVSSSGVVTAVAVGTATITATSEGRSGAAALTVSTASTTGPVATVSVTLGSSTVTAGGSTAATAVARDASGAVVSGRPITWAISSGSTLASVSSTGTVTAIAAGTATVRATIDGIAGTATLTIQAASATPIALPALPQVYLNHTMPPVTGRTIVVNAGDNLQNALNSAVRGDEIVLQAGATFTGAFILPAKSGTAANGWITVRSSALSQLPAGVRVTPLQASKMARIVTPDYQYAIGTNNSASGWYLAGLEVTVASGYTTQQNGIMRLGDGNPTQNSLSTIPTEIVLDRMWVHGQSMSNTKRCLALNSARTTVQHSYFSDCHGNGFDAQGIGGWNGPGPYKIHNNTIIGSAENLMFGGSDPTITNLTPSDIEIRGNYIFTPASWKGVWMKKNLFELKHARRVLVEDNIFDGAWQDGQVGFAFVLKSTNQAGGCGWCATTDVTIRSNIIRNAGAAFNLAGVPEAYPVAEPLSRVLIEGNLVESIYVNPYLGDSKMFQFLAGARDITIRRNTMSGGSGLNLMIATDVGAVTNVEWSGNIAPLGLYGIKAAGYSSGTSSWNTVGGTRVWSNAVLIGSASGYPTGTTFVSSLSAALAIPGVGADPTLAQRLSPVLVP